VQTIDRRRKNGGHPRARSIDRQYYPTFASEADVRAFEQVPLGDRISVQTTYAAIKLGAATNPDAPAIQFLPNADPAETPIVISHSDFVACVTQAANMFHALGTTGSDVVSFLLPLLPEAFVTMFGAEAAGIANPVNPLLEPHQIVEILEAARTTVLVALGPVPGTDIWKKVEQVRGKLKSLRAIVQVHGSGDPANNIYSFGDLLKEQPSDRLISNRRLFGEQTAAHFHTGGTTSTPHTCESSLSGLGMQSLAKVDARQQSAFRPATVPRWRCAHAGLE
jgi:fatty-acyl-CoA synthase